MRLDRVGRDVQPLADFRVGQALDGMRPADNSDMFNGAPDRYDWKLPGKREMYIPCNSYALSSPKLKYADILKPGHIDQDLTRYELHRVWVVEGTVPALLRRSGTL
ncbi:hypothetical protein D9M69_611280 [compost metagenome]